MKFRSPSSSRVGTPLLIAMAIAFSLNVGRAESPVPRAPLSLAARELLSTCAAAGDRRQEILDVVRKAVRSKDGNSYDLVPLLAAVVESGLVARADILGVLAETGCSNPKSGCALSESSLPLANQARKADASGTAAVILSGRSAALKTAEGARLATDALRLEYLNAVAAREGNRLKGLLGIETAMSAAKLPVDDIEALSMIGGPTEDQREAGRRVRAYVAIAVDQLLLRSLASREVVSWARDLDKETVDRVMPGQRENAGTISAEAACTIRAWRLRRDVPDRCTGLTELADCFHGLF